jgi:hypothetical protein
MLFEEVDGHVSGEHEDDGDVHHCRRKTSRWCGRNQPILERHDLLQLIFRLQLENFELEEEEAPLSLRDVIQITAAGTHSIYVLSGILIDMITKAVAPMPVRNLEMFLCVCAQLQLGTANPQKPTDSRTARSGSKRSAAEPHELYICIYRDLQAGAKLASSSSSSPEFLVKMAH